MAWLKNGTRFVLFVLIIVGLVIIAVLSGTVVQAAIVFLVLSTALTALSSISAYMQALEARHQSESAERPDVAIYFQPRNRLMYCVVQNFGSIPARNIQIEFKPVPTMQNGKLLTEISLFAKPITYLPPSERYWRHLGATPAVLELNPEPIEIKLNYSSTSNKTYTDSITVDFSVLAQANDPEPTLAFQLDTISGHLKNIADVLQQSKTNDNVDYHP